MISGGIKINSSMTEVPKIWKSPSWKSFINSLKFVSYWKKQLAAILYLSICLKFMKQLTQNGCQLGSD